MTRVGDPRATSVSVSADLDDRGIERGFDILAKIGRVEFSETGKQHPTTAALHVIAEAVDVDPRVPITYVFPNQLTGGTIEVVVRPGD